MFVDKRPAEILFLHGPKSSGKTTLVYRYLEKVEKEQKQHVFNLSDVPEIFTAKFLFAAAYRNIGENP
jgi:GTPase SAR1 family protein